MVYNKKEPAGSSLVLSLEYLKGERNIKKSRDKVDKRMVTIEKLMGGKQHD